jgi:hypothetical protein
MRWRTRRMLKTEVEIEDIDIYLQEEDEELSHQWKEESRRGGVMN